MITALVSFLVFSGPALASDYYPLVPGTKWTYQESGDSKESYQDHVLPPIKIGDVEVFPILTTIGLRELAKTFYRTEGDTAYVAAYSDKEILRNPPPVMRVADKAFDWMYENVKPESPSMLPTQIKASTTPKGTMKVLGVEREIIEVRMLASVLDPSKMEISIEQTTIYAKGVGMVEMLEVVSSGKKKNTRKVKLTRFEPPK